jgi:hypothetical protein
MSSSSNPDLNISSAYQIIIRTAALTIESTTSDIEVDLSNLPSEFFDLIKDFIVNQFGLLVDTFGNQQVCIRPSSSYHSRFIEPVVSAQPGSSTCQFSLLFTHTSNPITGLQRRHLSFNLRFTIQLNQPSQYLSFISSLLDKPSIPLNNNVNLQ